MNSVRLVLFLASCAVLAAVLLVGPLVALALIVAGSFVKAAIVPFHVWLADAHAVAPAPSPGCGRLSHLRRSRPRFERVRRKCLAIGTPMASRAMVLPPATPVDVFGAFGFVLLAAAIAIAALCSSKARRLFGDSPVFAPAPFSARTAQRCPIGLCSLERGRRGHPERLRIGLAAMSSDAYRNSAPPLDRLEGPQGDRLPCSHTLI